MSDAQNMTLPPEPTGPARKSPVAWTVIGIVLLVLSLGSWPRGLLGFVVSFSSPSGNPAYQLGVFAFGAALAAVGIVLLVRASRIRAENRALDAAAASHDGGGTSASA